MRAFFNKITSLSLRFKWITIVITAVIIGGGIYAFTLLNQELLPDIEFPQTFIVVQNGGATSDQILAMYALPIEEGASQVSGVVNVETVSNDGFGFVTVRNEFGLDQAQIVDDLQTMLDSIPLPVRHVDPPEGQTAADLIGELSPEAVLWLYNWAKQANSGFIPQLTKETLLAFSPDALGVLPPEAFADLDTETREAVTPESPTQTDLPLEFDPADVPPPALPESWQGDPRFSTVQDIVELTTARTLAEVFNEFYEEGRITGPLGNTDDLTPADIAIFLQLEANCLALDRPEGSDAGEVCSFIAELDAATILAMSPDVLAALPPDYLDKLSPIERNEIAAVRVAERLSGETPQRENVPLPESWQVEPPQIITFSFDDIPLGAVSVDSDTMTTAELSAFVSDVLVPRLRDADLVATVETYGGEFIPVAVQNQAREEVGLPLLQEETAPEDTAPPETADDAESAYPEGPALPPVWNAVAGIAGVEEFDSADDILQLIGTEIMGVPINSAADFINALAEQPTAQPLLDTLTVEILDYLAAQEPDFYENLDPAVLESLNSEPGSGAEDADTEDEAALESPALGEPWQQLSQQPLLAEMPLVTVDDLNNAGAVETINAIIAASAGFESYAIRLMSSLSPEALTAIVEENPDFLQAVNPLALGYLSREALQTDVIAEFLQETDDAELAAHLQAIIDGDEPTAAEAFLASEESADVFVDPDAPLLPPSWAGIAQFVNAAELDTADDIFNVPGYAGAADLISQFAVGGNGQGLVRDLTLENWLYFAEHEEGFWDNLNASAMRLINPDTVDLSALPQNVQTRIAAGGETYTPEETVTRTDFNPSFVVTIFKEGSANTVVGWENVAVVLDEFNAREDITINEIFEQASFITDSLSGVQREGSLGAVMAIIMILIFMNVSIRSTIVVAVSIPGSVFFAFIFIRLLPGNVYTILAPIAEDAGRESFLGSMLTVLVRLFPEHFTLNIMTLSGMTVAIGRVVDDSIVVLENIYRNIGLIKEGEETPETKRAAILNGTREVNVAIFAATLTTMVVFLPLGLFGGVTGAFFLPFGLAVTYALIGSYVVSITIVPVLASLFITRESMPQEGAAVIKDSMSGLQQAWTRFTNIFISAVDWMGYIYSAMIHFALRNVWTRLLVIGLAIVSLFFGLFLMGSRPVQFLPSLGEPTISVSVDLPSEFDGKPITIALTDARVALLENWLLEQKETNPDIKTIQVTIGSGGGFFFGPSTGVDETSAALTVVMETQEALEAFVPIMRERAELIFNDLNNNQVLDYEENGESATTASSNVTVSGAADDGGFGGFALVLKGADEADAQPTLPELAAYNETVLRALSEVDGLVNVELESQFGTGGTTYIRIDGVPALRYTGELETDDTIGTTQDAMLKVQDALDAKFAETEGLVPVEITQGFESEQQQEGIIEIFISMGIATLIAYLLLVVTFIGFRSVLDFVTGLILPIEILVSLPLSIVGAAVALTVTNRVLGLPAMVGLLMLIGIVVTNAIVLLDRVQQNRREKGMNTHDALVEAGRVRLRPILMTAATTTVAQIPLAASTESGAIIAAELGTVVIGGLVSSTFLTLIVLPVIYSLIDDGLNRAMRLFGVGRSVSQQAETPAGD